MTHRELALNHIWERCIQALCNDCMREAGRLYKFYISVSEMTDGDFTDTYEGE